MNLEKVIFSFFMILALTLNFGFFYGDVHNPDHHNVYELYAVIVINLIATIMKFGDRSQLGAMLLATSLVANVQLISAAIVWAVAEHVYGGISEAIVATIVSLTGGAVLANIISVVLLVLEASMLRH